MWIYYSRNYAYIFSSEIPLSYSEQVADLRSLTLYSYFARQQPILCNSEKKQTFVGCKIRDMRSRMRFLYPGIIRAFRGACECTWKYPSISNGSSCVQTSRSARKQGHDKQDELKKKLLRVEVVITLEEDKRFLCLWLLQHVSNFGRFAN